MSFAGPVMKAGTYTGSTAAQTLQIGFRPNWFIAYNQTDGDTIWYWNDQMTSTTYTAITTAVASVTATVTATDHGLILPASDSVGNENAKVYVYLAGRTDN